MLHYHTIKFTIPPLIYLPFYLTNFNTIASANFLAYTSKPLVVCRAIWYYSTDSLHNSSQHLENIRYNNILIAIHWARRVLKSHWVDGLCDDNAETFWYPYVLGWLESVREPMCFEKRDASVA